MSKNPNTPFKFTQCVSTRIQNLYPIESCGVFVTFVPVTAYKHKIANKQQIFERILLKNSVLDACQVVAHLLS